MTRLTISEYGSFLRPMDEREDPFFLQHWPLRFIGGVVSCFPAITVRWCGCKLLWFGQSHVHRFPWSGDRLSDPGWNRMRSKRDPRKTRVSQSARGCSLCSGILATCREYPFRLSLGDLRGSSDIWREQCFFSGSAGHTITGVLLTISFFSVCRSARAWHSLLAERKQSRGNSSLGEILWLRIEYRSMSFLFH